MAKRIAFLNNKGGVGKTFATVALAEAAARRGMKVLVADLDPQANATRRLRVKPGIVTLTNCLRLGVAQGAAAEYRRAHGWPGADEALVIDVLPADLDLEDRALEAGQPGADRRLRKALFGVDEGYDLTLIDCPPSVKGPLTTMAIAALDGPGDTVLVPLEPEYDAITAACRTVDFIEKYREDFGVPDVSVRGLIVNRTRSRVGLHETRRNQLAEVIGRQPVLAIVPLRARIAEVQDAGQPLGSDPELAPILDHFSRIVDVLADRSVTA